MDIKLIMTFCLGNEDWLCKVTRKLTRPNPNASKRFIYIATSKILYDMAAFENVTHIQHSNKTKGDWFFKFSYMSIIRCFISESIEFEHFIHVRIHFPNIKFNL
jgi:hypothetical protein